MHCVVSFDFWQYKVEVKEKKSKQQKRSYVKTLTYFMSEIHEVRFKIGTNMFEYDKKNVNFSLE